MSCFLFPEMEFQEYLHTPKAFLCVCLWLWLCRPAFLQTFSFFPSFSFRCRCLLKNRMRPPLCLPFSFSVSLSMLLAAFPYSSPLPSLCSFSLFPNFFQSPSSSLLLHLIALDWRRIVLLPCPGIRSACHANALSPSFLSPPFSSSLPSSAAPFHCISTVLRCVISTVTHFSLSHLCFSCPFVTYHSRYHFAHSVSSPQ